MVFFFFKQKTAYEMRISDWSSDVCSSDLAFDQQRSEGERLGRRPVDVLAGLDHLALGFELARDLAVEVEVCRHFGEAEADFQIGRASCRERVCQYGSISVVAVSLKNKDSPSPCETQSTITTSKYSV